MTYPAGPPSYPQPQGGAGWAPPPPPQPPQRPSTIKIAVALMWASAILSLLTLPLAFIQKDEIRGIVADDQPSLTESELDLAVTIGLAGAVIGGVIGVTFWIVNAIFCGRGAGWARIFGTVLFGFSLLSLPFSLVQSSPAVSRAIQVLGVLLSIAVVVLLWLPDSNRFFRESERVRNGR